MKGEIVRGNVLRAIAVLCLGLSLGACALAPEQIDINYASQSAADPPREGAGSLVELRTIDGRLSHRDRVGTKKNGYGVELARITASRSPLELVRSSVQQELTARGFTVGPGGVVVTIELLDFYSDFKPAFLVPMADSAAEVSFGLQVGSPGGAPVFSRIYRGKGTGTDAIVMTPGAARVALEQALATAMRQMTDDAALRTALVTGASGVAGGAAAPKPAAASAPPPSATPAASNQPVPPPPIDFGQGRTRSRL
jgi:uncharacterized lipoprotein